MSPQRSRDIYADLCDARLILGFIVDSGPVPVTQSVWLLRTARVSQATIDLRHLYSTRWLSDPREQIQIEMVLRNWAFRGIFSAPQTAH